MRVCVWPIVNGVPHIAALPCQVRASHRNASATRGWCQKRPSDAWLGSSDSLCPRMCGEGGEVGGWGQRVTLAIKDDKKQLGGFYEVVL